ncbi:DNA polymerase II large subunit [archaeon]|nr:DNA polymerase II large subunit [archaeon]
MNNVQEYFDEIEKNVKKVYDLVEKVRKKGLDPVDEIEIPLARNMAERVVGLISAVAPQIKDSNLVPRIQELEGKYGKLDWRVALTVAEEVAKQELCKFENKEEAMEVGIRVGIAYVTNGVVSSPLEGFTHLQIKQRKDGKEYFALFFSGPIRSAGGTGASVAVIIGDYVRKKMGYSEYDPSEEEVKRMSTELIDYHERVTNLQYFPSTEETEFMIKNLAVQIDGDPSEKFDVSNYKDIGRIETNKIRSGVCLVTGEGLCQKAPKLWKQLGKWGSDFDMSHWKFLEEFIKLQKRIKSKKSVDEESDEKIKPDFTYIKDLVAGRPVLAHPLVNGGFRLRYGRARNTGLSSLAISPCTMKVLSDYIAVGTQIKIERPSKGTSLSSCDSIDGPIVKLNNGGVMFFDSEEKVNKYYKDVEEIIYLGDLLVPYGDFFNRAHPLVPCGYNDEYWLREFEAPIIKKYDELKFKEVAKVLNVKEKLIKDIFANNEKVDVDLSILISRRFNVPLHSRWTYYWGSINKNEFVSLIEWLRKAQVSEDKVVLPFVYDLGKDNIDPKRVLELIGIEHQVIAKENVIISGDDARAFIFSLGGLVDIKGILEIAENNENVLDSINKICEVEIRDKLGTFIGARMGRPEKAKKRKMKGSPHVLFPVGEEGGRLRSLQSALQKGKVSGDFPNYFCDKCQKYSAYGNCVYCNTKLKLKYFCRECNKFYEEDKCNEHERVNGYRRDEINIREYLDDSLKLLGLSNYPELIKGIRGTSNKDHIVEHLGKGILRATHGLEVNKDGTTRFDATEMAITHFRCKEVGISVEKIKNLGYEKDINGLEITKDDQVIELKCQDIILPACDEALEDGADKVMLKLGSFLDDLLVKFYKMKKFYNFKDRDDIIGHYVLAIAPHISAGIVGRIIGFSKTQGFYAHPLFHCAVRRDCFGYDTFIPVYDGKLWKNVKIGEVVEKLNPSVVDSFGTKAKKVQNFWTLGYKNGKVCKVKINEFTKHRKSELLRFKLEDGRYIDVTKEHKFCILDNGKITKRKAHELKEKDFLVIPSKFSIKEIDIDFINLENYFLDRNDVMVRNISTYLKKFIVKIGGIAHVGRILKLHKSILPNFLSRNSFPLPFLLVLLALFSLNLSDLPQQRRISIKRDNVKLPYKIPLNNDVLYLIGLYVAEGYCRKNENKKKGFYQIGISCTEKEIKESIVKTMKSYFDLNPSEIKEDGFTFSSKILYEFFTGILKCGSRAKEKRIPEIILNLPKEKLASFLKGYYDGDGSVSKTDLRVTCDSISGGLLSDLEFALKRFGIFVKRYTYAKEPGPIVRGFYIRKKRKIPVFKITKLLILSDYCKLFYDNIGFGLKRKQIILEYLLKSMKPLGMRIKKDGDFVLPKIKSIENLDKNHSYCLNVEGNIVLANGIMTGQCDGDELAYTLLLDAVMNFSRKYLPSHRGATQDAPLVLTTKIIPGEVDDMVFDMDIADKYPLELYRAAEKYKMPWDVKVEQLNSRLGTKEEYGPFGFTHDTKDINAGVLFSAYKKLPTMKEKVLGQFDIAERVRAVDQDDVARLVIERHFMRDIRGNLRKFSQQGFRCSACNAKYRRPPLRGYCLSCSGNIIFTVSLGNIVKYLESTLSLSEKYNLPVYLKQTLKLTKERIESEFGKDEDRQEGLGKWF